MSVTRLWKVVFVDGTMTTVWATGKSNAMGVGALQTGKVSISAKKIVKNEYNRSM